LFNKVYRTQNICLFSICYQKIENLYCLPNTSFILYYIKSFITYFYNKMDFVIVDDTKKDINIDIDIDQIISLIPKNIW